MRVRVRGAHSRTKPENSSCATSWMNNLHKRNSLKLILFNTHNWHNGINYQSSSTIGWSWLTSFDRICSISTFSSGLTVASFIDKNCDMNIRISSLSTWTKRDNIMVGKLMYIYKCTENSQLQILLLQKTKQLYNQAWASSAFGQSTFSFEQVVVDKLLIVPKT